MSFTLHQVLEWTQGKIQNSALHTLEMDFSFSGIGTDTRKNLSGKLFVALKGDQFDGHDFLLQAEKAGAAAALVHQIPSAATSLQIPVVVVVDSLVGLQSLSHHYRLQSKALILAITGSNGKTTSKEFAAAIIGAHKKVHYSQGSFNNHWGVPFTLLDIQPQIEVAVVEMGMNHSGEIKDLVQIAEPDVVVCTTVGRAHIENFGSVAGIAAAKEEIYIHAPATTQRIFNLDNPWTEKMHSKAAKQYPKARLWTFSAENKQADVFFKIEKLSMQSLTLSGSIQGQSGQVEVPVFGEQNLCNLMVAAALALAVGLSPEQIWSSLPLCKTNWGRNQLVKVASGAEVIFDGYNANPDSMAALLKNMRLLKNSGQKIGVFGQMLELGDIAKAAHQELAVQAVAAGLQRIYFIGALAEVFKETLLENNFAGSVWAENEFSTAMADDLKKHLLTNDIAVIKGSRGMKMERFLLACEPLDFSTKT
jgi:UDP-N-acetylmuramoyl-tripeptide--D-alanyl-D-alanine ligase